MRNNVFTVARDAVTPSGDAKFSPDVYTVARPLYWALLLFVAPTYVVGIILAFLSGMESAGFALMGMMLRDMVVGFLFITLFATLWCWFYPVRVGDSGVAATDFWGRKLSLSWGEMETVTPTRFCGLPYLKVASFRKDRAVLWLPLFVRQPDALKEAIVASASAQNPMRQFMESPEPREPPIPAR